MKKFIAMIILSALCLTMAACGKSDVPDGMQDVSGEGVAYSLYIPATWNPTHDVDGGYYSQDDKSSISMTSYYPEQNDTIESYWNRCKESYSTTYGNFTEVGEPEELVLGGKKAVSYVFTGEIGGTTLKYRQIMAIHSGKFYIMTYTSTPENYDLHEEEIKAVIENFKFK